MLVRFHRTTKGISPMYTCIPFVSSFSPPPSHPSGSAQLSALCCLGPAHWQFYTWGCVCVNAILSACPTLSSPLCPQVHPLHLLLYVFPAYRLISVKTCLNLDEGASRTRILVFPIIKGGWGWDAKKTTCLF